MTAAHALWLGVLQGLTEFLPVSSSGHLVLVEHFAGLTTNPESMLGFNVLLHAGTLLALLYCYASTWAKIILSPFKGDQKHAKLLVLLVLATLPAALFGLLLKEKITESGTIIVVAVGFAATGVILLFSEYFPQSKKMAHTGPMRALLIGCAQVFALIPGISRAGITISAGRAAGLSRAEALDFSFLMAVPVIAGANILLVFDVWNGDVFFPSIDIVLTGLLASTAVSVLAILFLRRFVVAHSLAWFAAYLLPLAGALLILE